jgi:hypothetical protein
MKVFHPHSVQQQSFVAHSESTYSATSSAPAATLTYDGVYWLGQFLEGDVLNTTALNGEQVVWDVSSERELYRYRVGYGAVASPSTDGKSLAVLDGSDARMVPLQTGKWTERLCSLAGRELTEPEKKLAPEASEADDLC